MKKKVNFDAVRGLRGSSNEDEVNNETKIAEWDRDKVWVIGSSYCHSRQFKVDQSTFEVFKMFNKVIGKVATPLVNNYSITLKKKMKKLRLGLNLTDTLTKQNN